MSHALEKVLVITVRKSFWASRESERFPNRVFSPIVYGRSTSRLNSLLGLAKGLLAYVRLRPRLIFVGSAVRIVPWLVALKRFGLLGKTKLLVTNQTSFDDEQARFVDRVIVYSHEQIRLHDPAIRDRYVFMPLPADGDFASIEPTSGGYIFSGGGEQRDFASLIEAVRGMRDVQLKLATFSPATLGCDAELPPNCELHWRMPLDRFLTMMAGSLFVVVPLIPGPSPHGQTTVVQALRLGKAVVATRGASLEDYVRDGKEGILVEASDAEGYRRAIRSLRDDHDLRARCERHALERAADLTYERFAERATALCEELIR